jgi:hypothetical protein
MSYASIVKCEITTVFSSGVGSAKSNICNISSVVDVHTRMHLFKVMRSCVDLVLCTVCNPFFNEKINKILNVKKKPGKYKKNLLGSTEVYNTLNKSIK